MQQIKTKEELKDYIEDNYALLIVRLDKHELLKAVNSKFKGQIDSKMIAEAIDDIFE